MDETLIALAESVLVNKVEKDTTFTEVDAAYILPVVVEFPVRVEKYRLVTVKFVGALRVEQNKVLPVSVEKVSLVTVREEVIA
jgi:hypothetical protein